MDPSAKKKCVAVPTAMLLARAATLLSSPAMGYTHTNTMLRVPVTRDSAGSVEPPEAARAVEAGSWGAGTTGELGADSMPVSTFELGGAITDAPATIHSILQGLYDKRGTFAEETGVRRSFYEQIVFPRVTPVDGAEAEAVGHYACGGAQVRVLELASPLHEPITKLWGEGDSASVADMSITKDGKQVEVGSF